MKRSPTRSLHTFLGGEKNNVYKFSVDLLVKSKWIQAVNAKIQISSEPSEASAYWHAYKYISDIPYRSTQDDVSCNDHGGMAVITHILGMKVNTYFGWCLGPALSKRH